MCVCVCEMVRLVLQQLHQKMKRVRANMKGRLRAVEKKSNENFSEQIFEK